MEVLSDEELEPEIIRSEPVVTAEPYPLQTIVDPRRPAPSRVRRALAIAGSVGVIASVAALRMYTPSMLRTPAPRRAPRRDDTQPGRIVPTPVPVVCPPPPPASQPQLEAAPVKSRDETPTQPLPVPHKRKVARVILKKVPTTRASESQKRGEVRQGALLDPFGQDD